ncbi:hypothetical protein D3C76_1450990 [compost metagenome]
MISAPSDVLQRKSFGTAGNFEAGFTPMCKYRTPASCSSGTMAIVCPGTSVILAAIVVLP